MKTTKIFILISLCLFTFSITVFAKGTNYKGVYIERGKNDTYCVYVTNANQYPVEVQYEYKLGSRDAEWQKSEVFNLDPQTGYVIHTCYSAEIKALRIIYVDILQPSVIEKIIEIL